MQCNVIEVFAGAAHRHPIRARTAGSLRATCGTVRGRSAGDCVPATPLCQDALLFLRVGQHHIPQTLIDVVGKLGDDTGQPAGQPFDGVPLIELCAEDQVADIACGTGVVGSVGAEEVDAEVGVRHVENRVQRRAHGVLPVAVRRRFDDTRGGQVIADMHDHLEQRMARQRAHRADTVDHAVERQVLVGVGSQRRLPRPGQHVAQGGVAA